MKKTININLAGYPFIIDEDAYNLLKDYLDTIRYAFDTDDDTGEIASDIESRVAELLLERKGEGKKIVTRDEITKVIERIGQPSEFIDIEEKEIREEGNHEKEEIKVEEERITPPPYNPINPKNAFSRKRIFRDPQGAMLGGVCAGLARYLHVDVTIIRLITVLLFFLSATTVAIVYVILWIVVPEANTPLQRMQMMGQDPTMENIGRTVSEKYQEEDILNNNIVRPEQKSTLSRLISILVKCLIIIGLIITLPVIFVLGATFIGCIIAVFVIGIGIFSGGMFDSTTEGLMVLYILLAVIGGAITLGVPVWLLIRKLAKRRDLPSDPSTQRAILIVWLIGMAMVAVFTVQAVKKGKQLDKDHWGFKVEQLDDLDIEDEELESIDVNPSGVTIKDKNGKKVSIKPGGITVEKSSSTNTEETTVIEENTVVSDTIISNVKNFPDSVSSPQQVH